MQRVQIQYVSARYRSMAAQFIHSTLQSCLEAFKICLLAQLNMYGALLCIIIYAYVLFMRSSY